MSAAQQSANQDVGWLAKGQTAQLTPLLAPGLTGVLQTKGLTFSSVIKINCYPQLLQHGYCWRSSQKKWYFTPLTCISQVSSTVWLNCSVPYKPTPWTHPAFSVAAQRSLILNIFDGISTHACCETSLVLAAPQTEPLHERYWVPQPQHQYPQTPCSCLTTKHINPLCRKKWAEKQKSVLGYYSS